MQQKTRVREHNSAGTPADAVPYTYDLPVVSGGGQPEHAPRPARPDTGWSVGGLLGLVLLNVVARAFADLSPLPKLQSYALVSAFTMILCYWATPKPRQGFWQWTLKIVGLILNFYIGFVTVPGSLRGLLPAPLAFGLPAFVILFVVLYWMPPLVQTYSNRKSPLWQLLLCAAAIAALWGWVGPGAVK
jgi:hypothetical protein